MKPIRWFFLITICIIGCTGCKKDKDQPNGIVTINNMSFGCKVNGQPFIADEWDYGNNIPPLKIKMLYSPVGNYNYMFIRADKANSQVSLFINSPLVLGRKYFKMTTNHYPQELHPHDYGMYSVFTPSKNYMTNEIVSGYMDIINVYTVQRKMEARFEFEAISQSGEKVKVSNGYFKLN